LGVAVVCADTVCVWRVCFYHWGWCWGFVIWCVLRVWVYFDVALFVFLIITMADFGLGL